MHHIHCMITLVLLCGTLQPVAAQNQELIRHIDALGIKDYLELNSVQGDALKPLLKSIEPQGHCVTPIIVLKKSKYVSHDLIIVEIAPLSTIPGASFAVVHFFRADGGLIRTSCFNLGYRQLVRYLRVVKYPDIDEYLIETDIDGKFAGLEKIVFFDKETDWLPHGPRWTYRQTYAFQQNDVRLIRLVNEDGIPISNPIYVKHFNYGPLCEYTLADVEKLLQSDSVVDQLHALVWLNGRHCRPCYSNSWYEHQSESLASIAAYKEAYTSPSLAKLLDEKIKHSNYLISYQAKWVKSKLARPYNMIDPNEHP